MHSSLLVEGFPMPGVLIAEPAAEAKCLVLTRRLPGGRKTAPLELQSAELPTALTQSRGMTLCQLASASRPDSVWPSFPRIAGVHFTNLTIQGNAVTSQTDPDANWDIANGVTSITFQ
jgi:hypothetical protein